ncbi:serine/threonine-protein kinase BCK1/SLK1/SSP31-like [Haliotis rubra]|uniref:serine/threonine-protein kinase BCK1/SLK1/SSP31-like n=1 Tax=Haliotis rubra TaxID=36100 RepID=UPI001EE58543|nr:serine/threonine-protein kinase BCK1/SLK1/SSP31-like [Haliotis rubra]
MSRKSDKRRTGLQCENKKLEREIEELEDALLLHKHIHNSEQTSLRTTLRKEVGGSRWEHGGQGRLRTYKSSKDLEERYSLEEESAVPGDVSAGVGGRQGTPGKHEEKDSQLVKVGSVDRMRSSARLKRDNRKQKEQQKTSSRPVSGKMSSSHQPARGNSSKESVSSVATKQPTASRARDAVSEGKLFQDGSANVDGKLFPTDPLKIDSLKHKVLQKVSANVIHRPAPPDPQDDVMVEQVFVDHLSSQTPGNQEMMTGPKAVASEKSVVNPSGQASRRARDSRQAARAPMEDYINMVAGSNSKPYETPFKKTKSAKVRNNTDCKEMKKNRQNLKYGVGGKTEESKATKDVTKSNFDEVKLAINDVERVNMKDTSVSSNPKSREVLTSDYSSDLETSPDRWDDPQFGGACFERDAWLASLHKAGDAGGRPHCPLPSDDISDTPVLGGLMDLKNRGVSVSFNAPNVANGSIDTSTGNKIVCHQDVVTWLQDLGLRDCNRYIKVFAENEIDMETLKDLTAEQLNQMGITAVGPVNKILRSVSALKSSSPSANMTVDELLAAVGSTLKQNPTEMIDEGRGRLQRKMGKDEFDFSVFAGEEGKDEIKKKLREQNVKILSMEQSEREVFLASEKKRTDPVVEKHDLDRKPPVDRKSYLESQKDIKPSSVDESKGVTRKQRTPLQRSSSASRVQSDRERSLSSDGSTRGRQLTRQKSVQSVPKKLPSGKQTAARDDSADGRAKVGRGKSSKGRPLEVLKKQAEAGISAAAQKREDIQTKTKKETLQQQRMEESRRKRRDKMAAKHTGRGRLDSKGSVQLSTRPHEADQDPLEFFSLPPDPGNKETNQISPQDTINDNFPIRVEARPIPTSVSPRKGDNSTPETSLSAREKIKNVDLMIRDLQRKSVDKQKLTLDIVRDLQKQLEEIEKGLASRTNDELQQVPEEVSSPKSDTDSHRLGTLPERSSPRDNPASDRSAKQMKKTTSVKKSAVIEPSGDVLHDLVKELVPVKYKGKEDPVHVLTSASVSKQGQSSRSKMPSGVASLSMSKRELLDEIRKEKDDHRKQIRHLQSELTRLQHNDPVRKSELDYKDLQYQEEDLIGEGAFSRVYRARYQGADVAVKRLRVPLSSQDKNYFAAEVSLLRDLRHPRVVMLIGVCTSRRLPLMVLEYMCKGNLFVLLHNPNRESLDHAEYYQIARDIAAGMVYLHNHRPSVLHLDLKSMNVLIGTGDRAKIADFGFSKLKHEADQNAAKASKVKEQIQGSPAWMAPELLQAGEVTPKADVYSFGMILWEMLTRKIPYDGSSMFQILEKVRLNKRPEIPMECPVELAGFISRCWDHKPARRPVFKEVLSTLESLSFPPDWRALFQQAGVPQEALEDVQSTRNIISLVTSTLESTKLASLLDVTAQGQGELSDVSESGSSDIEEDLDESSDMSDDSLESEEKDNSDDNTPVCSRVTSARSNREHKQEILSSGQEVASVSSSSLTKKIEKLSLESVEDESEVRDSDHDKIQVSSRTKPTQIDLKATLLQEISKTSTSDSPRQRRRDKDQVESRRKRQSSSPESAVSKFSELPTPRKSREAWSFEDIPAAPTSPDFPHNHIPPPPAPPPPPPLPPPSNPVKVKSRKEDQQHNKLQNVVLTPQILEARTQKLKPLKRDRDQKKGAVRPRITPKPVRSAMFVVGASDLQKQRGRLKPTQQPHPNQLEDLAQVNGKTLSSIAEILRDAMSERRFAMGEDLSASCDHAHSDLSWSTQDD